MVRVMSVGVDEMRIATGKVSTTVAMDFGRLTLAEDLVLYVFGTPGQHRFWFMWDDIVRGAIAAVVLVDTRRLADCFPSIDYFESRDIPFLVAAPTSSIDLSLPTGAEIPIEERDGREVSEGLGRKTAPPGVDIYNPAFDVTPNDLVTAIMELELGPWRHLGFIPDVQGTPFIRMCGLLDLLLDELGRRTRGLAARVALARAWSWLDPAHAG